MILAVIGWPDVFLALIIAPPAYVAAYNSLRVRRQVEPSNGGTLAATLEQAHQSAANTETIVTQQLAPTLEQAHSSAAKTETIVKRRLGERHNDAPIEKRPRVKGERDDDGAVGE